MTSQPCPYAGLLPFSEANNHFFYGRKRETEDLLQRLHRHPLLAVIGRSGSGKSSLVFAGLVPALRQSQQFGTGKWLICQMRPSQSKHWTPLARLAQVLQGKLEEPKQTVKNLLASEGAERLLLIVDQFEELFTIANRKEQREFQRQMVQLSSIPNCYVILIMRADFFGHLVESPIWPAIQTHRMLLQPLDIKRWAEVITRPAEKVGVFVEPKLVEQLSMEAASKPEQLHLAQLQQTLTLLWQKVEECNLSLSAYQGLVDEPHSGLQIAIEHYADSTLAALSPNEQAIAQRFFLRLVHFGDKLPHIPRQQRLSQLQSLDDDEQEFKRTWQKLASSGLLILSSDNLQPSEQLVDLPHAALIEHWPALQQWLSDLRQAEQTRRELEDKAKHWIQSEYQEQALLPEEELQQVEQWLTSAEAQKVGLTAELQSWLAASRKSHRWMRLRKIAIISACILIVTLLGFLYLSNSTIMNVFEVSL